MEVENKYASKGVAGSGLGLGIAGTALGLLNGGLNGILGGCGNGWGNGWAAAPVNGCIPSENMPVTRYDAQKDARIAELETEVKLRDANTYTDQKSLALYQYIDGELKDIRNTLCGQAVHNQRTEDSFALARQDIAAVKADLDAKIKLEAERRCCGDNAIVRYVNATFYPKMVADVTTGTTTTSQTLYDPLPDCGCCK
jgi:hypothetical protein